MIRRLIGRVYLYLFRWTYEGHLDEARRCVVVAAPHTTNWDLAATLAIGWALELNFRWMGKKSLFRPPFGWIMRAFGGVPVDRSTRTNLVQQAIDRLAMEEDFALVIPPEGTRSKRDFWKSGFYHIAVGARVPIALSFLDYRRKVGGIGPIFRPTGDVGADMDQIRAFYSPQMARFPERFTTPRLAQEDEEVRSAARGTR